MQTSLLRAIIDGWKFVGTTPMVRGLVVGILGAFAAGGAVVGVGRQFAKDLNGGDAAYGVLFGAVFAGLALGMLVGPKLLRGLSPRRKFGMTIVGAGLTLAVDAVLPNLVIGVAVTTIVGFFAGLAWVTGYTLLGGEVPDEIRGRTFSLVQSLVQVDLLLTLSLAPVIAAFIGNHHQSVWHFGYVRYDGVTVLLFVAGLLAIGVGVAAFRQMDDRPGVSRPDRPVGGHARRARCRRSPAAPASSSRSRAARAPASPARSGCSREWLTARGHEVVTTHEPGGTAVGAQLRALLLDRETTGLSPRAEALLYAADRAAHVDSVIRPALQRGAVVVTDRYVDSSVAYQGAGRVLPADGDPRAVHLGDRRPAARPHRRARHRPGGRAHAGSPSRPTGSSPSRSSSTAGSAPASSRSLPADRSSTSSSMRRCRSTRWPRLIREPRHASCCRRARRLR